MGLAGAEVDVFFVFFPCVSLGYQRQPNKGGVNAMKISSANQARQIVIVVFRSTLFFLRTAT